MLKIKTYKSELFPTLIDRIWVLENTDSEAELIVPPNQYVNMVFLLNGSNYIRNNESVISSQIEGVSTENTIIKYPPGSTILGVRFYAFGLYPFVQIAGNKIFNNSIENPLSKILDNKFPSNIDLSTDIVGEIDELLEEQYCSIADDSISKIMSFYNRFRWSDESYSIEDYCKKEETNYTSLNREFKKIIGITPKKFERLIKFRKSLCSLIDSSENLTSIGIDSGYFDQAHFIREFKLFLNQTPSNYQALIKLADSKSKIINYNFKIL